MEMKKLLIIMLTCWSLGLMAQNAPGVFSVKPMAGINVSTLAGGNHDYDSKVGFTAGAELEYGINEWLGLSLGMLYSQQGAKMKENIMTTDVDESTVLLTSINGKIKSDYLNLPLMACVYIPAVKGLSLKAGVQLGVLLSDKQESNMKVISVPNDYTYSTPFSTEKIESFPSIGEGSFSTSNVLKSIDFGIPVGLSYEYKNISLDARYYFGMKKIDNTEHPENIRNRNFTITLGYLFHLGKK